MSREVHWKVRNGTRGTPWGPGLDRRPVQGSAKGGEVLWKVWDGSGTLLEV